MATFTDQTRWLRRGAFAAGLVAAVTLAVLGRVPGGAAPLGLDAMVTTAPTGELAVGPVGTVAAAAGLAPGDGALRGRVTLENQTDAAVAVRVRARPSIGDADAALHVRVAAGSDELYSGPAGGLRRFSARGLTIGPHASATVDISAWLPEGAAAGWRGRSVTLPLEYRSSIDGKGRS